MSTHGRPHHFGIRESSANDGQGDHDFGNQLLTRSMVSQLCWVSAHCSSRVPATWSPASRHRICCRDCSESVQPRGRPGPGCS